MVGNSLLEDKFEICNKNNGNCQSKNPHVFVIFRPIIKLLRDCLQAKIDVTENAEFFVLGLFGYIYLDIRYCILNERPLSVSGYMVLKFVCIMPRWLFSASCKPTEPIVSYQIKAEDRFSRLLIWNITCALRHFIAIK